MLANIDIGHGKQPCWLHASGSRSNQDSTHKVIVTPIYSMNSITKMGYALCSSSVRICGWSQINRLFFPSICRDFVKMFPDESACAAYLERLRWPGGFICPACQQQQKPWRHTRSRLVCPTCRHQCTVTAGTIFDKTRTPLTTWFDAAWHVTTAKNGLSAKTLERMMGVSYRVAWYMLHRFRVAMVRTPREPLSGEVEVDETMIGGVEEGGKRGRGTNKEIVVIAVEIKHPKGFGRMPGVHRVASLLKRWLLGTHQGAFTSEHLQSYLEEFTFRFNRRTSSRRGQLFRRLLEQAVATHPVTRAEVRHGYQWKPETPVEE